MLRWVKLQRVNEVFQELLHLGTNAPQRISLVEESLELQSFFDGHDVWKNSYSATCNLYLIRKYVQWSMNNVACDKEKRARFLVSLLTQMVLQGAVSCFAFQSLAIGSGPLCQHHAK